MKTLQIRIEEDVKAQAQAVLSALGLDMSTAVRLFFTQVIEQQKIPFEIALSQSPPPSAQIQNQQKQFLHEQEVIRMLEEHQNRVGE